MASSFDDMTNGIILTREELALVARLVGGTDLPGTFPDPLGELSDEQAAYGLLYAERSLRARGLASIDDAGEIMVDDRLLRLVVTCIYADRALWLFQTPHGGPTEDSYGYLLKSDAVLHTKPSPSLHHLRVGGDDSSLVGSMLGLAGCAELPDAIQEEAVVPGDHLAGARAAAASGDIEGAAVLLGDRSDETVRRIALALSRPHDVSIFVHLVPGPDRAFRRRELTVLRGADTTWLLAQNPADRSGPATLERVGGQRVAEVLVGWLGGERRAGAYTEGVPK